MCRAPAVLEEGHSPREGERPGEEPYLEQGVAERMDALHAVALGISTEYVASAGGRRELTVESLAWLSVMGSLGAMFGARCWEDEDSVLEAER